MAFLSRSSRETGQAHANPELGPGSYNIANSISSAKPAYSPFGSTALRGSAVHYGDVTPGPGSYSAPRPLNVRGNAGSNAFKSKTVRFGGSGRKEDVKPGPGSYAQKDEWKKPRRHRPLRHQRPSDKSNTVVWVRAPTAPSIPTTQQSYGYEEGKYGQLVMQRPPRLGHTGKGSDTVGPGGYDPRSAPRRRTTDFSRSRSARTDFTKTSRDAPGPGRYSGDRGPPLTTGTRQSAVFASKSQRAGASRKEKIPGPGSYKATQSITPVFFFNAVANRPEELQFFGSTSKRFAPTSKDGEPGPGAYAPPSSFHRGFDVPGDAAGSGVGFSSTQERFRSKARRGDRTPGAGTYEVQSMTDLAKRRLAGRTGVFGSTTKRFHATRATDVPGPGAYSGGVEGRGDDQDGDEDNGAPQGHCTSAFASTTQRWGGGTTIEAPDPGAYDVGARWETATRFGKGVMASGARRFDGRAEKDMPGPGAYSPAVSSINVKGPARKNVFVSGSERFQGSRNPQRTPGPGTYDVDYLYGNLNKPSFNMSIVNETN